jgi:hypothetical protein
MKLTYRAGAGVLLVAGLIAGACGDDGDEGPSTLPPAAPPELSIESIRSGAGEVWTRGDTGPIKLACEQSFVVNVQLTNWTLRPPLACPGVPNCGYLALSLDDVEAVEAAQTSLAVDLSAGVPEGVTTISVELVDGTTQQPFVQTDGGKASDAVDVTFELPTDCESGAGGAAGAGGAGGQGGAPGAAGAGGQPGAGGSGAPEGGAGGAPSADAGAGGQGGA